MTLAEQFEQKGLEEGLEKGLDITVTMITKFGPPSILLVDDVKILLKHHPINTIETLLHSAQSLSDLTEMIQNLKKEIP